MIRSPTPTCSDTFDNDGDGDVDMKDYILGCSQYVKDVYKNHKVRINCFIALLIWISAGVVFGMVNQEWSFVTSLYFAVSSLSTGGLKSVNTRVTDDGVTLLDGKGGNGFVSFFNGFYAMTGVPVFGVALGRVARRSGDEAPKTVVTPISSKLEQWRDKYRAGYTSRPAPENFGEKVARPFRFTRPAVGWRCNLCFARNAADAASCELCHEAKPEAAAA